MPPRQQQGLYVLKKERKEGRKEGYVLLLCFIASLPLSSPASDFPIIPVGSTPCHIAAKAASANLAPV